MDTQRELTPRGLWFKRSPGATSSDCTNLLWNRKNQNINLQINHKAASLLLQSRV